MFRQHGADDGKDDLCLDDGRLPRRRAFAPRPERQDTGEPRRDRQPRERVLEVPNLLGQRRRPLEHVGALRFFVRDIRWNDLRHRGDDEPEHEHEGENVAAHLFYR